jgi:ribosomal protein S18 acetylase RimI-like enzyme
MKEYRLRPATRADLPQLAAAYIAAWRETYADLLPAGFFDDLEADPHFSLEHWEALQQRWDILLIEEETGTQREVVGFALFGESDGKFPDFDGQIEKIYLRRSAQGAGQGRRLMQAAARALLEQGKHSLILWVIQANEPALHFYRHFGGVHVGTPKGFEIGGRQFHEIAFGWPDLTALAAGST